VACRIILNLIRGHCDLSCDVFSSLLRNSPQRSTRLGSADSCGLGGYFLEERSGQGGAPWTTCGVYTWPLEKPLRYQASATLPEDVLEKEPPGRNCPMNQSRTRWAIPKGSELNTSAGQIECPRIKLE